MNLAAHVTHCSFDLLSAAVKNTLILIDEIRKRITRNGESENLAVELQYEYTILEYISHLFLVWKETKILFENIFLKYVSLYLIKMHK